PHGRAHPVCRIRAAKESAWTTTRFGNQGQPKRIFRIEHARKACTYDFQRKNTRLEIYFPLPSQDCLPMLFRRPGVQPGSDLFWIESVKRIAAKDRLRQIAGVPHTRGFQRDGWFE